MKACPFCAEEIQDAAIVCKHCGRDLARPDTGPVAVATAKAKGGKGMWVVLALLVLGAWFIYYVATSSATISLPAAQQVKASLERDGVLTDFSCGPNRATLSDAAWMQLTTDQRRKLMGGLSRVCIEVNKDMRFVLYSLRAKRPIASFDGRNVTIE